MNRKSALFLLANLMAAHFAIAQLPSIQWAKCYGGNDGEVGRCMRQTADTGYIVVGNAGSANGDVYKNAGSF
jgi:hypothetical protein